MLYLFGSPNKDELNYFENLQVVKWSLTDCTSGNNENHPARPTVYFPTLRNVPKLPKSLFAILLIWRHKFLWMWDHFSVEAKRWYGACHAWSHRTKCSAVRPASVIKLILRRYVIARFLKILRLESNYRCRDAFLIHFRTCFENLKTKENWYTSFDGRNVYVVCRGFEV